MTGQELVNELQLSEIHQVADISSETFISFINSGLRELHVRFELKTKEYLLTLCSDIADYMLPEDVIKILTVHDETGIEWGINDESALRGIMQPNYNRIRLINPAIAQMLSIIYVAAAPQIKKLEDNLDVISPVINPLMNYVVYKVYLMFGAGRVEESRMYYAKYEKSCLDLVNFGVVVDEIEPSPKFLQRGFV